MIGIAAMIVVFSIIAIVIIAIIVWRHLKTKSNSQTKFNSISHLKIIEDVLSSMTK